MLEMPSCSPCNAGRRCRRIQRKCFSSRCAVKFFNSFGCACDCHFTLVREHLTNTLGEGWRRSVCAVTFCELRCEYGCCDCRGGWDIAGRGGGGRGRTPLFFVCGQFFCRQK